MKKSLLQLVAVITPVLLLCLSLNCRDQGEKREADLKLLGDKLIKAFNSQDAAGVAQLYTENQITIEPGSPEPVRGRKAKADMVAGYFKAFPDLKIEVSQQLISGNHIVFEGLLKGTHTGPLVSPEGEVPPTGRSVQTRIAFVVRVSADGLIEEDRTYYDNADFMKQLGLLK